MNIKMEMFGMAAILLAGMIGYGEIQAAEIFDNGTYTDSSFGNVSDVDFLPDTPGAETAEAADDFVLAPGRNIITDVHWWGLYFMEDTPGTDDFTIRIYETVDDAPAASPIFTENVGAVSRTDTGDTQREAPFDQRIFEYWSYITGVTLDPGERYWLSIQNDTTADDDDRWYWVNTGSFTDGNAMVNIGGSGFIPWEGLDESPPIEFAFRLTGVPEPASLALLGIGLAGLVFARRKKLT